MSGRQGQAGFALIAVLWLIAASVFIVAALAVEGRSDRRSAVNAITSLRTRAAARAGIAEGRAHLLRIRRSSRERGMLPGRGWQGLERAFSGLDSIPLDDGVFYSVSARDLGAQLPLNRATEGELRRLFIALALRSRRANVAAQSILDWRDPDDLHRAEGAEWDDYYRHLEHPVRPRNGPFASLEELRAVRGVNDEVFARVAPHLTVRGEGRVNLNGASEPVLRALPGLGDQAIGILARRRRFGRPIRDLFELSAELAPGARERLRRAFPRLSELVVFEARQVELTAMGGVSESGLRTVVRALAVPSGDGIQLLWQIEG